MNDPTKTRIATDGATFVVVYPNGSTLGYDNRGAMATGYPLATKQVSRTAFFLTGDKAEAALKTSLVINRSVPFSSRTPAGGRVAAVELYVAPVTEF